MTIYLCERCGSRFNSARFAHIELCPRCLLRDDFASHLVTIPGDTARREPYKSVTSPEPAGAEASSEPSAAEPQSRPSTAESSGEPDAADAELG